jgi:hypothetical protein
MTQQLLEDKDKEYHLKRLEELAKIEESKLDFKVDGSIWKNGKPIAEEPTYEQKKWFNFRFLHHSTWPKVHENKIGDYKNWK